MSVQGRRGGYIIPSNRLSAIVAMGAIHACVVCVTTCIGGIGSMAAIIRTEGWSKRMERQ